MASRIYTANCPVCQKPLTVVLDAELSLAVVRICDCGYDSEIEWTESVAQIAGTEYVPVTRSDWRTNLTRLCRAFWAFKP